MAIKLGAVAAIGAGAVFVYSGVRGYSVLKSIQNIIQGTTPTSGQSINRLSQPGNEADTSGSSTGGGGVPGFNGDAAGIAEGYIGKLTYYFGGPNPQHMGTVDCSSFTSRCLAQAGVKNPGGAPYDPRQHGPTTVSYLGWNGAKTIGHSADVAQRNDLCVWQTHMGIATGNGKMVSARDPAQGVGIDNIAGDMPGEFLFVRRIGA